MATRNNIVTFEEARRSAKRRRPAVSGSVSVSEHAVTTKLEEKKSTRGMRTRKRVHAEKAPVEKASARTTAVSASTSARLAATSAPTNMLTRIVSAGRKRVASGAARAEASAPERSATRTSQTARTEMRSTAHESAKRSNKEAAKRRRGKARAEKKFAKLYGKGEASASASNSEGGPRAAVYQAKMGAKHRKAAQALQQKAAQGISAASGFIGGITLPDLKALPKRTVRILTVIGCAAFLTFMLYAPAQQCYQQVRERDRVAAEYAAVMDRNQALADSVDMLQTEEGIEDKAHAEYGMVKDGEEAGSVSGIDVQSSTDFVANVVPGGVAAPDTWYSGVLDLLFGYSNPQ